MRVRCKPRLRMETCFGHLLGCPKEFSTDGGTVWLFVASTGRALAALALGVCQRPGRHDQACISLGRLPERGSRVTIVTDASPWGFGAFLTLNGKPTAWFALPISDLDLEITGHARGDCRGQQSWEALCVLILFACGRRRGRLSECS